METLKQTAINAISQLPETATFNDIQAILEQLKPDRNAMKVEQEEPISFLEADKDFIGSLEGPEDLSTTTNANAKKEIRTRRKPSPKIAGKGKILGDIMTPVVDAEDWRAQLDIHI